MQRVLSRMIVVLVLSGLTLPSLGAKAKEPPKPSGWCYAARGPVDVRPKASEGKKFVAKLGRGVLLPTFQAKDSGGRQWIQVRAVDPATLTPQMGWVPAHQVETFPLSRFQTDAEVLKMLGGPYLDDFVAAQTALARYFVRQGNREPAVVCFLGSPILPNARLQMILRAQGKAVLGPYLEFSFSDLQSAIRGLEIRDLFGDGNESLLTRETFYQGPENHGVNLVIRKIEASSWNVLWKAPVEFRNLGSFPPKIRILAPPEKNIGVPGTVTTGSVDFRPRGAGSEPVWKGKVEFFAFGREAPVETVPIEKVCSWDGTKFAPLY